MAKKSFKVQNENEIPIAGANLLHETSSEERKFEPIRIHFDFSAVECHPDKQMLNYVKTKYTKSCGNYFQKTLKVFPVQGPLRVDGTECETNNAELIMNGVNNTDLIIIVKFEHIPDQDYVAAATFCQVDAKYSNRPTAGVMVVNTAHVRPWKDEDWTSHFTTCIHELTHVMALNPALFNMYVDKQGNRLGWDKVVKKGSFGGVELDMLTVEPLISRAREYFNCPTLQGFALEGNNTNPAVENGHFNPNWILNEIMAPRDNDGVIISEFFFALYEATGWYMPDYRYAELSTYGRKLGCPYVTESCQNTKQFRPKRGPPTKPLYYEFCYAEGKSGCTADYNNKAVCISDASSAPCSYYLINKLGSCHEDIRVKPARGEVTSKESKCILGTVHREREKDGFTGRCYKVDCERVGNQTVAKIIIGNNEETIVCNQSNVPLNSIKFKGYVICPNIEAICPGKLGRCPNECSYHGFCTNGMCFCHIGYRGKDCSKKADWEKHFYNPPIPRNKSASATDNQLSNFSIPSMSTNLSNTSIFSVQLQLLQAQAEIGSLANSNLQIFPNFEVLNEGSRSRIFKGNRQRGNSSNIKPFLRKVT